MWYASAVPLRDVLAAVDQHFAARVRVLEAHRSLNDRGHQYRMVQRRLLSRYRDRTPAAMGGMDVLLHDAHAQCMRAINDIEEGQAALAMA